MICKYYTLYKQLVKTHSNGYFTKGCLNFHLWKRKHNLYNGYAIINQVKIRNGGLCDTNNIVYWKGL